MQSTTVVTAMYRLKLSKHPFEEYIKWIHNFFANVPGNVVCFCSNTEKKYIQSAIGNRSNVEIRIRELDSFELANEDWTLFWKNQVTIDPQNKIRGHELYIVWALKQQFVHESIQSNTFESKYFVWCDIGYFRDENKRYQFPCAIEKYAKDKWISSFMINNITFDYEREFMKKEIGIHDNILFLGGCILGDVEGWSIFRSEYLKTLTLFKEKNFFAGNDQMLYIYALNKLHTSMNIDMFTTTDPKFKGYCFGLSDIYGKNGNHPFKIMNILTRDLHCEYKGQLGNLLFILASHIGLANQYKMIVVVPNWVSKHPVLSIILNNVPHRVSDDTNGCVVIGNTNICHSSLTPVFVNENKKILLQSYLQNPDYFRYMKDDLRKCLLPTEESHCNRVMLHIRRTDYAKFPDVYVKNDEIYYTRSIAYMRNKYPGCKFDVFSDDISAVRAYSYLKSDDIEFVNDSGKEPFEVLQMMMRYKQFIIANSTFSWWAAWLANGNTVAPSDWFADTANCPSFVFPLYEVDWVRISNNPFSIQTDIVDLSFLNVGSAKTVYLVKNPPTEKKDGLVLMYVDENTNLLLRNSKPNYVDHIVLKDKVTSDFGIVNSWSQSPPIWIGDIVTEPAAIHRLQDTLQTLFTKPDISIILPIYNTKIEFVMDCLHSIYRQSYRSWELILLDDGSTNQDIISLYKKSSLPKTLIIPMTVNSNLPITLNKGIFFARGEYLARMDADDIMFPHRLEKQIRFMKDNKISICGTLMYMFYEKNFTGLLNYCKNHYDITILNYDYKTYSTPTFHPTVMYSRSFIIDIGSYDDNFRYCEDYELWMRILSKGHTIYNIQEPLLYYRIHGSNFTIVLQDKTSVVKARVIQSLTKIPDPRKYLPHILQG